MNTDELPDTARQLLETLAPRLPENDLSLLRELADAWEWREFFDQLTAVLTEDQISVTTAERDTLRALLAVCGEDATEPVNHLRTNDHNHEDQRPTSDRPHPL